MIHIKKGMVRQMSFDGIFMHRMTELLKDDLISGKISRIYQVSNYELLILIRAKGKNHKLLLSCHPNHARMQLTNIDYPTPKTPSQLVMSFRKHLEGAFIKDIVQLDLERIVRFEIIGRNEIGDQTNLYLYVEIMGKHSNIILCQKNNRIIDSLKRISPSMSTVRIIQPGATYTYPPLFENKISPFINEIVCYDKMYLDYAGLSPVLSREFSYRYKLNQNILQLLENMMQETHIYICENGEKEDYHLLPLSHIDPLAKPFPIYEGLDHFYQRKDENDRIKQHTSDLQHFIKNELQKNTLKLNKLEQTLFDSTNSEDLRLKGELLYSYIHLVHKGMSYINVENYYDGTTLTIELDPRFDGKDNAKRYFNRYQKSKNSIAILSEQIDKTKEEIDYFEEMLALMEQANYYDALEMKEVLENLGYIHKKKKSKIQKKSHEKPHFETWIANDGTEIYIGKNNIQNDYLTFKYAKKKYYWFHVKDMPGSHIIVCHENPDEYLIRLAANLAALYSKAQNSSSVPVNYTTVQSLKKAPGNKLGKVILSHYKTIYIDPDKNILDTIKRS